MTGGDQWSAGVGRRSITPEGPIWLAGFGTRTRPSEAVLHDIHVNAFALQAGNDQVFLLISADILGFSRCMCDQIRQRIFHSHRLDTTHIFLSATHNHSCPVNTGVIPMIYNLGGDEAEKVDRYTAWMLQQIHDAACDALDNLFPAALEFGQGFAGFGVNRRRVRPGCRDLPGPVDQDVPVLMIRSISGELRGLIYGFACHTTALAGYFVSADFPGFTRQVLEESYPDLISAFIPGCGGDINPLPRGSVDRAKCHGSLLAETVLDVIADQHPPFGSGIERRILKSIDELGDPASGTRRTTPPIAKRYCPGTTAK